MNRQETDYRDAAAAVAGLTVIGVGAVAGDLCGPRAVARHLGTEQVEDDGCDGEAIRTLVTAFKRQTRQRYIDKAAELGIKALNDAVVDAGLDQAAIDGAAFRIGILIATGSGPVTTRSQYLSSYVQRGGKSASATLFSNCGYNIVGAMLARSRNLRGPVVTFGTGGDWSRGLLATARRFFQAGRADCLFVGRAEAEGAVMIGLRAGDDGDKARGRDLDTLLTAAGPGDASDLFWRLARGWWQG